MFKYRGIIFFLQWLGNVRVLPAANLFCFGQFVFKVMFCFVCVRFVLLQSRLARVDKKPPRYQLSLACKSWCG